MNGSRAAYHEDASGAAVAKVSLIVGNSTPKWDAFAVGTDKAKCLRIKSGNETFGLEWAYPVPNGANTGDILYWNATAGAWTVLARPTTADKVFALTNTSAGVIAWTEIKSFACP